jgi:elongation factor G
MSTYKTEDIRNIALVGHAGSGKTTLAESLLFHGGAISHIGTVEEGNTVSDHDPLEKTHQHSISSSVLGLDCEGCRINLVDTPGYPDFLGSTISALPAVETVAVVVNAHTGIETLTRQLMGAAPECDCCRMIIINKIDTEDVDLPRLLEQLQGMFGTECLPLNLPANNGSSVVDCFFNPSGDSDFSSVAEAHTRLVDQVVEVDEALMELYLEQGEVAPEQLHDPFEQALREGHIIPVCFVSARTGVGVKELLDVLVKLAPNPKEGTPHAFLKEKEGEAKPLWLESDQGGHTLAHVFKVSFDPFVGKQSVFRIHQGRINKESQLFVNDSRKAIKVGHLYQLQGKNQEEIRIGIPGDICAVGKIEEIHWDDILHDSHDEDDVHLKPLHFPSPMAGLAIETERRGDEQKLSEALNKLSEEDPCLTLERDATANETVLRGLGELHLRMALEKLTDRFHVQVQTHTPSIPYRETIRAAADGHHRHKKQTGGAGQFGEVYLRIEPLERGTGFEFCDNITGGVIPGQFVPAVEKGVRQAMEEGAIAGFPIQDVRVSVYDGKFHNVDSNEVSFIVAGRKAFLDAMIKAKPVVLEPIVNMEVNAPDGNVGDLAGDLSSRRGRISGTESHGAGTSTITAQVPLAELENYQSRIKSVTGGEGSFAMHFSHYDRVPPNIQQTLKAKHENNDEA